MRKKIYVSPSANRKNGYPNRYFVFLKENLAEYFDVLDADNEPYLTQGWALLKHSFKAEFRGDDSFPQTGFRAVLDGTA